MKADVTWIGASGPQGEAQVVPAQKDSSIGELQAANPGEVSHERSGFQEARERSKARLLTGYDLGWIPPASRDEIYER